MLDRSRGLTFSFDQSPDCLVVNLVGDLNMFSAPELRTQLIAKLNGGTHRFIFELSALTFVDSSGIGTLVSFVSMCKNTEGGKVILCGLNPQIHNIFEVTRLLSVFSVVADLAAAHEAIAG